MEENNKLIINSKQTNLLNELKKNLKECERFYFSVAFINYSGLQLLLDTLKEIETNNNDYISKFHRTKGTRKDSGVQKYRFKSIYCK